MPNEVELKRIAGDGHPQATRDQPAQRLLGIEDVRLPSGQYTRVLHPNATAYDIDGRLLPGVLCVLADCLLGGAAVFGADATQIVVTSSLHLELTDLGAPGGDVTGVAESCVATLGAVVTRALLCSPTGPIAHATARFAVLQAESRAAGAPVITAQHNLLDGPAAESTALPLAELAPLVAMMRPELTGVSEGWTSYVFAVSPELRNERDGLHGGIGALIGEQSAAATLRQALPEPVQITSIEIGISFLRPLSIHAGAVQSRAQVVHLGGRTAATRAELLLPDGRPAVLVNGLYRLRR